MGFWLVDRAVRTENVCFAINIRQADIILFMKLFSRTVAYFQEEKNKTKQKMKYIE